MTRFTGSVGKGGKNAPRDVAAAKYYLAHVPPPEGSAVDVYWQSPFTSRASPAFIHWVAQYFYDLAYLVYGEAVYSKETYKVEEDGYFPLSYEKDFKKLVQHARSAGAAELVKGPKDLWMLARGEKPAEVVLDDLKLPAGLDGPLRAVLPAALSNWYVGATFHSADIDDYGHIYVRFDITVPQILEPRSGKIYRRKALFLGKLLADRSLLNQMGMLAGWARRSARWARVSVKNNRLALVSKKIDFYAKKPVAAAAFYALTGVSLVHNDIKTLLGGRLLLSIAAAFQKPAPEGHAFSAEEEYHVLDSIGILEHEAPATGAKLRQALERRGRRHNERNLAKIAVSVEAFLFVGVEVEAALLIDTVSAEQYLLITPIVSGGIGNSFGFGGSRDSINASLAELTKLRSGAIANASVLFAQGSLSLTETGVDASFIVPGFFDSLLGSRDTFGFRQNNTGKKQSPKSQLLRNKIGISVKGFVGQPILMRADFIPKDVINFVMKYF